MSTAVDVGFDTAATMPAMVARLQRWVVFALLSLAASIALFLSWVGFPAAGLFVAVVILCSHAFVLAAEFVCLALVETRQCRPSLSAAIRAWWGEALIFPLVFYWRQPYRTMTEPDHLPSTVRAGRGVVLIHGLTCNRGFWNPWMKRLRQRGIPFVAPDLEPLFGSIEAHSGAIDHAVRRVAGATGLAPVIVAHSMGGLAVRHWLDAYAAAERVNHVITIGTPHRGTWLARFGLSRSGREMALGSDWLGRLASREGGRLRRFTCFYSECDNIVFPSSNAQLAGAENRHIPRTAHVALAFRQEVFAETLRRLDPPQHFQ